MGNIDFSSYTKMLANASTENPKVIKTNNPPIDDKINNINDLLINAERQKQTLRKAIVIFVSVLLFAQLVFFNYIVWLIIHAVITQDGIYRHLLVEESANLLSFLKYYISATVVELLGMLFFIVRYAFSKVDKGTESAAKAERVKMKKKGKNIKSNTDQ